MDALKDRSLDVVDWIDYRPDPHWWPVALLAVVLGVSYFELPKDILLIMVFFAIGLTSVLLVAWGISIGIGVGLLALVDFGRRIGITFKRSNRISSAPR